MVHQDFWPSDLFGEELERKLKKIGNVAAAVMIFVYSTAALYFVGCFVFPLSKGDYNLPLNISFGFKIGYTPLFEILYFVECLINFYVIMSGVRGHDDFFIALCANCMVQFRLLKEAVSRVGSGKEKETNSLLDKVHTRKKYCSQKGEEFKLLVRCVEHHKKLLEFCDDLQTSFTGSLCIQLLVSLAAICVSSFALIVVSIRSLKASSV